MSRALKTLNDICELIVDCEHKTAPVQATGYPSIRTPNIGKGRLLLEDVNRVSEETYQYWTKRAVPRGSDLILAREAPIGNVAIVPENLQVCLGQRTVLIRPNQKYVEPNYLVYLMLGDDIQGKIRSLANGATVHHLNMKDIRDLELPELPPLPTQRKIAAILSAYDDLIENNTRRIKILEEMAQSLYREWFVHFRFPGHEEVALVDSALGPIPEGWDWKQVCDVAVIRRGRSYRGSDLVEGNAGLPFINLKCIDRGGGFRRDGLKRYQGPYKQDQTASNGDIVMAVTDMTQERRIVARAARVPNIGESASIFSMDLVKIDPKPHTHREYLYGLFRYSSFPDHVKQYANGANVLHLNPERIEGFTFPCAPDSLQAFYAKICSDVYQQSDVLTSRNDNLRRTRDLLLPRLVSGELDVSDLAISIEEAVA